MKKYCIDCGKEITKRAERCGSCAQKGELHYGFGKYRSEETKNKMAESHKGIKFSDGWRKNISESLKDKYTGEDSPRWNQSLTDEDRINRRLIPGIEKWRCDVYTRDDYTCQLCGQCDNTLNAHHMNGWNLFPEERLIVENGITLCEPCHKDFHKQYGRGNNTRAQLIEFFKGE